MFKKKLVTVCAILLLVMSRGSQAETSPGNSPIKTRQAIDSHLTGLKSLFPSLQGTTVDHASGVAVLTVYALPDERSKVMAKQPDAETLLGSPVRIDIIGAPLKQQ